MREKWISTRIKEIKFKYRTVTNSKIRIYEAKLKIENLKYFESHV